MAAVAVALLAALLVVVVVVEVVVGGGSSSVVNVVLGRRKQQLHLCPWLIITSRRLGVYAKKMVIFFGHPRDPFLCCDPCSGDIAKCHHL